jgi:antitoxin ParD1/3/4
MPIRVSLNVSLTSELEQFIESRVASGRYQTASELIREGLRLLRNASRPGKPPSRSCAPSYGVGSNRPTAASSLTGTPCSKKFGS